MSEIEKYKTNSKVSGIYKSLEKTIKSLESIVDKIEDKTELMDSIN
jgi:exonuclease VII small subunit